MLRRLLSRLHRIFDHEPHEVTAFRLDYSGEMSWRVSDNILTTSVDAEDDLSIDLTQYTFSELATHLSAQPGYQVSEINLSLANRSARTLLTSSGSPSQSNGNRLLAHTSELWALLGAIGAELTTLKRQIETAPKQMQIGQAGEFWLDHIGEYYGVPRNQGEDDRWYAQRIIARIIRPMCNNLAISSAVNDATGWGASVVDAPATVWAHPLRDGRIRYNAALNHQTATASRYGEFDVSAQFDLEHDDVSSAQSLVISIVNELRAAGTRMRQIGLSARLQDQIERHPEDVAPTMAVHTQINEPCHRAHGLRHDGSVTRADAPISYYSSYWQHDGTLDRSGRYPRTDNPPRYNTTDDPFDTMQLLIAPSEDAYRRPLYFDGVSLRDASIDRIGSADHLAEACAVSGVRTYTRTGRHRRGDTAPVRNGAIHYNRVHTRLTGRITYAGSVVIPL